MAPHLVPPLCATILKIEGASRSEGLLGHAVETGMAECRVLKVDRS